MIVIAKASNQLLAAVIVSVAIVAFAIFLIASAFAGRRRRAEVAPALRPGPSDEELEGRFLPRVIIWSTITMLFMAVYLPAYWLREPRRINTFAAKFSRESVERGEIIYRDQKFSEHRPGAPFFAANCQRCHGLKGEGTVQPFKSDYQYAEPPLRYIVARYKAAGRNDDDIKQLIRDAIERGRPGTLMPTWGLAFGGPLNSQQVDDAIAFIYSIQDKAPGLPDDQTPVTASEGASIFAANCATCHTRPVLEKAAPATQRNCLKGSTDKQILEWSFGACYKSGVFVPDQLWWGGIGPDLRVALDRVPLQDLMDTIKTGRLNYNRPSMPAWAFLGKNAVSALVEFVKSIQVSHINNTTRYQ